MEFTPETAYNYLFKCIHTAWEHGVSDLHLSPGMSPGCRKARSFLGIDHVVKIEGGSEKTQAAAQEAKAMLSSQLGTEFFQNLYTYWSNQGMTGNLNENAFVQIAIDHDRYWRARVELVPYAYATGLPRPDSTFALEVRIFAHTPIGFADLQYPEAFFNTIRDRNSGIVLVGGLASSGRSTTLASMMIQLAQETPGLNIATLEAPIEYILRQQAIDRTCRVLQTEVPRTKEGWFQGLSSIVRRDFNVVMVSEVAPTLPTGEVLDLSDMLLEIAGNGSRVFSTIAATDFWEAFRRFTYRPDPAARKVAMESAIRHLNGIMVQQLVPVIDAGGWVFPELHCGCMLFTDTVRNQLSAAISNNSEHQLRGLFRQYNRDDVGEGCLSFFTSASKLIARGITRDKLFLGMGTFGEG